MMDTTKLDVRETGSAGEFILDIYESNLRVGSVAYTESSAQVLINYVQALQSHEREGYGTKMIMFLIDEAEQLGIPLRTGRLTTPGRRLFEGMRDKGLITLEETNENFLEYKIKKAPVEAQYG